MPLEQVVSAFARHGVFVPQVDRQLQVTLPGELVGALVLQVVSRDVVIVELVTYYDKQGVKKQGAILAKSGHSYRPGDIVPCQRSVDPHMGVEIWVPVEERKFREMENAERLAAEVVQDQHPGQGPEEVFEPAAPEIGSGPAAEPETTKKVLGPRRSHVVRLAPEPAKTAPHRRSVLGPRRSKIAGSSGNRLPA